MAKGSLIGKADSTVVSAAYRAAMANVPKDNLESLKITREAYKSTLDTVEGIWQSRLEDYEATNQDLTDSLASISSLSQDGTLDKAQLEDVSNKLVEYKDKYMQVNKMRKGAEKDKAKLLLDAEVSKYVNGVKSESNILSTNSDFILNNAHNPAATGDNLKFLRGVYAYHEKKPPQVVGKVTKKTTQVDVPGPLNISEEKQTTVEENVIPFSTAKRTTENGEIFYTVNVDGVEVKKSMNEIKGMLTTKVNPMRANVAKTVNDLIVNGKNGLPYDADEVKNALESIMVDPKNNSDVRNTVKDFMFFKTGSMPNTIAEEIHKLDGEYTQEIFSALNKSGIFVNRFDTNNDNKLSAEDFEGENAKNYMKIAKHITDAVDVNLSKNVAFDIFSASSGAKAHQKGFGLYQQEMNKTGNTIDTPFGSISKVRAKTYVDELISRTNVGDEIQDLRGNDWVFNKDGRWHAKDADVIRTRAQMFEKMSMQSYYPGEYQKVLGGNIIPTIEGGGQTDPSPATQTFKDNPNYDTIYDLVGSSKFNSVTAGGTQEILSGFESLYPDFTFTRPRKDKMEIRKNGELVGLVDMDRFGAGNKNKSVQKVLELINSFNK